MYNLQYLVYVDFNDILYQDMLNEDIPLPKPEKMTLGQITSELELRGLSTTGSRSELNGRLTQDDLSIFVFIINVNHMFSFSKEFI